jgi:hypothetical protein
MLDARAEEADVDEDDLIGSEPRDYGLSEMNPLDTAGTRELHRAAE